MRSFASSLVAATLVGAFACGADEGAPATTVVASPRGDASPSGTEGGASAGDPDASVTTDASGDARAFVPAGCVTDVSSGHRVFDCDGIRYDVEVPATCPMAGCGIVLDVHGLTMNADQEDASTNLRALGAQRGYVIVQPTAPSGVLGPSWTPGSDDAKVWSFLESARTAYAIDPRRVHVTGFSQGGALSFRFVCKHADVIASAAPIAAASASSWNSNVPPFVLDCPFAGKDVPAQRVSILQMHGTKDGLVPIAKGRQQRDAVLAWLGPAMESVVSQDSAHVHQRYASTQYPGVVFEYVEHDYEVPAPPVTLPVSVDGHCFPGGQDLTRSASRPLVFGCKPPNAFVWGSVVMDFFAQNPKPGT